MKIKAFPKLETDRLLLRKIEASDSDMILFLRSDATINKFIQRPEHRKTKTLSDALQFIKNITVAFEENKSISWGITLKDDPKIIGSICLWNFSEDLKTAEVGYDLSTEFQRKGIMSEAFQMVVAYGFQELKFKRIEAMTHMENENSRGLLEKNGFFITDKKDPDNDFNIIYEIETNYKY